MEFRKRFSAFSALIFSCASFSFAEAAKDVDDYVYHKYSGAQTSVQGTWGTLNCHDPKLFQDADGTYYVYSTDAAIGDFGEKGLQIRTSKDLVHWTCLSDSALQGNWDEEWLEWTGFDEDSASTWAPTVIRQNGLYYMLHGIITENIIKGRPSAAITLAIASSPKGPFYPAVSAAEKDPDIASALSELGVEYSHSNIIRYSFMEDFCDEFESGNSEACFNNGLLNTQTGEEMDSENWMGGFGCIDPEFVTDVATGKLVEYDIGGRKCYGLTYGSWKGGIAFMYVDSVSLKPVDASGKELDASADTEEGAFGTVIAGGLGAAYEGAQVIYNSENKWYYLFVSMGNLEHEYRVGCGRSKKPLGPYVDAGGKKMLLGGIDSIQYHAIGSKIRGAFEIEGGKPFRCTGGQSIMRSNDGKILFASHTRTNFLPGYFFYLQVNQMFFTESGWPVLNQNEYYNDYAGADEGLRPLSPAEVAGEYDVILTVRDAKTGKFRGNSYFEPVDACLADAVPTVSKKIVLNADGKVSGAYSGKWSLGKDGYSIKLSLKGTGGKKKAGEFTGFALNAVDWSRNGDEKRRTISITTIDMAGSGEYFWGNKR